MELAYRSADSQPAGGSHSVADVARPGAVAVGEAGDRNAGFHHDCHEAVAYLWRNSCRNLLHAPKKSKYIAIINRKFLSQMAKLIQIQSCLVSNQERIATGQIHTPHCLPCAGVSFEYLLFYFLSIKSEREQRRMNESSTMGF